MHLSDWCGKIGPVTTSGPLPARTVTDPSASLAPRVYKQFSPVRTAARTAMTHPGTGNAGKHIGAFLHRIHDDPNIRANNKRRFVSAVSGPAATEWAAVCQAALVTAGHGQAIANLCWAWGHGREKSSPWLAAYAMDAANPRTGGRVLSPVEFAYVLAAAAYQVGPAPSTIQVPTVLNPVTGQWDIPAENDPLVQQVRWWRMRGCSFEGRGLVETIHDRLVTQEGGTPYAQARASQAGFDQRAAATVEAWQAATTPRRWRPWGRRSEKT